MKKFIIIGASLLALSIGASACGTEEPIKHEKAGNTSNTVAPGDNNPQTTADEPAPEPEPARVRETPDAKGKANINVDYELGDFGDSGDPSQGYRFTAGGTLHNTGNIGIRVRVTYKWKQSGGQAPVVVKKVYKVRRHETRDVGVTIPATQDQIDSLQSLPYDAQTSYTSRIIDTFGQTPYEDS